MPSTGERFDPLIGTKIDERYLVEKQIGAGGMGVVYAGVHTIIDKQIAIKVIRDASDPTATERFLREAKAASKINHPNIVDVFDFGKTQSGSAYFVMERIEGRSLFKTVLLDGPLPSDIAVDIAIQIAAGLGAAHAKGIIHRDLKSDNVFLVGPVQKPFVKILDFGIAKMHSLTGKTHVRRLTQIGSIFGTPEYMAPEQAAAEQVDYRADIYSLGAVLYEMLTGRVPFKGATSMDTLTAKLTEDPPSPHKINTLVKAPLSEICMRALHRDPNQRFQNMNEFTQALEWWKDKSPRSRRSSIFGEYPAPKSKKWPWFLLLLIASAVGAAFLFYPQEKNSSVPEAPMLVTEPDIPMFQDAPSPPIEKPDAVPPSPKASLEIRSSIRGTQFVVGGSVVGVNKTTLRGVPGKTITIRCEHPKYRTPQTVNVTFGERSRVTCKPDCHVDFKYIDGKCTK